MFERYTDRARRVLFFARYEAIQLGSPVIEPVHLLLGLIREAPSTKEMDNAADSAFTRLFVRGIVKGEPIRLGVEERVPFREKITTSAEVPFSRVAEGLLQVAAEEADQRRYNNIGIVHLFLSLCKRPDEISREVLDQQQLNYDSVVKSLFGVDDLLASTSPDVKALDLSGTDITEVPQELRAFQFLDTLDLSHNRLTEIPGWLQHLSNLTRLDASHNELTRLPDSMGDWPLETLDVSRNRLSKLPMSFLSARLSALYLHDNADLPIPPEILGPTRQDVEASSGAVRPAPVPSILNYYRALSNRPRPLNEAKLILVGRGTVGKTSLVKRLVDGLFNRGEAKTDGIMITRWPFEPSPGNHVLLHIWDFGGQEIMHATHQFFLTQRSLYVLVLAGRDGGEDGDAEYWLRLIDSFGAGSPVIVVLNKIAEYPFDVNRRGLRTKFQNVVAFVTTDCAEGIGIEELRNTIQAEALRLEHIRTPFPGTWFLIKDRLARTSRPYVTFDEFRKVCSECGESGQEAQHELARYLHHLGIALNFSEDQRLQDTHVLDPHWVTNGVYKILNSALLHSQKGVIDVRDLRTILNPVDYPEKLHFFLFDLMRKFDLCFAFPENPGRFLIPELVDKQEHLDAGSFDPEECLNFEYRYSVLPEGLIPRFIVRTHAISESLPRWRSGVILQFEGNRGLVKSSAQEKRVYCSVTGPLGGRRRLLAVIRADLERIHREIRNLAVEEVVPVPGYPSASVPYADLVLWESEGRKSYAVRIGDRILDIDVGVLLNGVDLERTVIRSAANGQRPGTRVFLSYSHRDEPFRAELDAHLKLLQRQGVIDLWNDRKIVPGDDWRRRIDDRLAQADIILLLVSPDFLASDYCYEEEMKTALRRHSERSAKTIPIIVRDVDWRRSPFAGLQALPAEALAISKWQDRDSGWRSVAEGIVQAVEELPAWRVNQS